jgi:hypothetical protein
MLTYGRHRNANRSKGQALVEFAFVAPLFFLLLFGIIEAGRFIFYYEVLNNATREGARYAIVNGANSLTSCSEGGPTGPPAPDTTSCDPAGDDVRQAVRNAAIGTLGTAVTVTPTWFADNGRGSKITVAASYTYSSLIPIVPLPNITVTAESSLVINN